MTRTQASKGCSSEEEAADVLTATLAAHYLDVKLKQDNLLRQISKLGKTSLAEALANM